MHEMSLAVAMIDQLVEAASREGATEIVAINVVMGAMSGVEREPFEFVFPFAAEGTPAASARLEIEEVPVEVRCEACGETTGPEYPIIICVKCSSTCVEVVTGREFNIKSMEVR